MRFADGIGDVGVGFPIPSFAALGRQGARGHLHV